MQTVLVIKTMVCYLNSAQNTSDTSNKTQSTVIKISPHAADVTLAVVVQQVERRCD